jgi:NAD(P)H-nitrite reductase large subunit
MLFRPADFYQRNRIELIAGKKVNRIDPGQKIAELTGGDTIAWDKLLLSTGGSPITPPMKGLDRQGVFNFITLGDAKQVDEYLTGINHAVVIGGGLIGISVTEALAKRGVITTVVEMKDHVLNTILDETASAAAELVLRREGIKLVTGHTVTEISGLEKVSGVTLDDGSKIPCEMVIVAIGVVPRVELARDAGLKINRGIIVDRQMRTSATDIYACGDASEAYDYITDSNHPIPIWPNAYIGGRAAGYNMAGRITEYPGGTAMNSINYFGIDISSAGLIASPDDGHYSTLAQRIDAVYRKVILRDGIVKGMIFVKDIDRSGLVFGLMRDGTDVSEFQDSLIRDDFGLAHLPASLRLQHLGALGAGQHIVPLREEEEQPIAGE